MKVYFLFNFEVKVGILLHKNIFNILGYYLVRTNIIQKDNIIAKLNYFRMISRLLNLLGKYYILYLYSNI